VRYRVGREPEYSVEDVPLPYSVVGRRLGTTDKHVKSVEARALTKLRYWAERGKVVIK